MIKLNLAVLILFLIISFKNLSSQEKKEEWGIKFSGFIKSDFWLDNRICYTSREGLFLFYPEKEHIDYNGVDLNKKYNFNFSAMTSRLTSKITGPDAFGAKTFGMIEGDFSGVSNNDINGLRLRHAYVKLNWEKTELMLGQYWHPLFTTDVFPDVVSLNTGAPFNPFNRSPLINLKNKIGKLSINNAIISQRDNQSLGPKGYSPNYMRNAIIPNYNIQIQYANNKYFAGIMYDVKMLVPQLITSKNYKTDNSVISHSYSIYGKYFNEKFIIKTKAIYGQNLTEHLMIGGYAVQKIDTVSNFETYLPTNHLYTWINLTYNYKNIKLGIFGGYLENFGTSIENIGIYYARGADIKNIYRYSPSITITSNKLSLMLEYETTIANFGNVDNYGKVNSNSKLSNSRILFTSIYFF